MKRKRHTISEQGRANISLVQQRRWAQHIPNRGVTNYDQPEIQRENAVTTRVHNWAEKIVTDFNEISRKTEITTEELTYKLFRFISACALRQQNGSSSGLPMVPHNSAARNTTDKISPKMEMDGASHGSVPTSSRQGNGYWTEKVKLVMTDKGLTTADIRSGLQELLPDVSKARIASAVTTCVMDGRIRKQSNGLCFFASDKGSYRKHRPERAS